MGQKNNVMKSRKRTSNKKGKARKASRARPKPHAKVSRARRPTRRPAKGSVRTMKATKVAKAAKRNRTNLKLLENAHIRNLLTEIAGEKALKIVGEFTQPLSDEQLASRTRIKVSEVRAVLNKLHSAGIAYYDRTRDKESGWFSYTWNIALTEAQKILEQRKEAERAARERKLSEETSNDFYACPNCFAKSGTKLVFDKAMEAEFRCPECAGLLKYVERRGDEIVLR